MTKPRVILAEDHELVGQGLIAMLSADYDIVATITDGAQVVAGVSRQRPAVLLLDLSLPNRNGIDLLQELRSACPDVRVLVLTMHVDSHLVDMALKLGAAGFVPKSANVDELKTAIAEVLAGRRYVSPKLPKHSHHGGVADPMGFNRLTKQQQGIVRMIAKGMNSEQIARELGLSVWTVHFHRKSIRRVLGIRNDMEMHRYAILAGSGDATAEHS